MYSTTSARVDSVRAAPLHGRDRGPRPVSRPASARSSRSSPPSLLSLVYSMMLFVAFNALRTPIHGRGSGRRCPAGRRLQHHPGRGDRAHWRSRSMIVGPRPNGWTGDRVPRRAAETGPQPLPVPRPSPSSSSSAISGLTARLFYLQIVDGGRLATLSTRNRTVLEPIRRPARRHLRPQWTPARVQRPDVRGQAPSRRPAARPNGQSSSTGWRRCCACRSPTSTPRSTATPGRRSTSSASRATSTRRPPGSSPRRATTCPAWRS